MTSIRLHDAITSFDTELSRYTAERKQVSDRLYHFLHTLVGVMALCSIAFAASYAWSLGESLFFRIIITGAAAGIECSLIFFAAAMYPKIVLKVFGVTAGLGVIVISIFTAMSFLLSQQYAAEHQVTEIKKSYATKLQTNLSSLDVTNDADRGTIGRVSDRLEVQLKDLEGEKGSKATAVYHYAAATLGVSVESVSFIMRLVWALVFVSVAIALASFLETIYSPSSLGKWIEQLKKEREVLNRARIDLSAPLSSPQHSPTMHLEKAQEEQINEGKSPNRYRRSHTDGVGDALSESMYQRIKKAVEEGAVKPSVAQLKKIARGTERAYQAIDRMMGEGVIQQQENGRYMKSGGAY